MSSIILEEAMEEAKEHPKAVKLGGVLYAVSPFLLLGAIIGGGWLVCKQLSEKE